MSKTTEPNVWVPGTITETVHEVTRTMPNELPPGTRVRATRAGNVIVGSVERTYVTPGADPVPGTGVVLYINPDGAGEFMTGMSLSIWPLDGWTVEVVAEVATEPEAVEL